jgi:hypothetical protein
MDFLSRDIAVVDVSSDDPALYHTLTRIQSADLPAPGTDAATVQRGKYLFNTAIGPVGTQPNSVRPSGRMSDTGWGTCYAVPERTHRHSRLMFADGPRQAISMEARSVRRQTRVLVRLLDSHQRALNWSGVRDEVQDFPKRRGPGAAGLIRIDATGAPVPEGPSKVATSRSAPDCQQRLERRLDAANATYLAVGVRAPISPMFSRNPGRRRSVGRSSGAGCQNCHGGRNWTISALTIRCACDG